MVAVEEAAQVQRHYYSGVAQSGTWTFVLPAAA
jgi:hypothetical protein